MSGTGDLHTHTVYSDGVLTPDELLAKAKTVGLSAISVTDHDNIEGTKIALELGPKYGLEVISGIELSCFENGKEYHILGYGFDVDDEELQKYVEDYRVSRLKRAEAIHSKLQALGVEIHFDDILEIAGSAPVTRPHIAAAIKSAGYVDTLKDAFNKFIGDSSPAYHGKPNYSVENAVKMINRSGGVAILAHPANFVEQSKLYKMIEVGLDGIEVIHPMHNDVLRRYYASIASQYWLIQTGGSDFHGNRDWDEINFGKETVPASILDSLKYRSIVK